MRRVNGAIVTFLVVVVLVGLGLALPAAARPPMHGIDSAPQASSRNKLRDVDWWKSGQEQLEQGLRSNLHLGLAKNVILFVGDGMGVSTVTAARILKAQQEGKTLHDTHLAWERYPHTAMVKTYNVDQTTPDSAGTATAMLTGIKTNQGVIGVGQKTIRGNCSTSKGQDLEGILHFSHKEGKWTGIVTTSRITHATPASAYANSPERKWEYDGAIPESEKDCDDIALQLLKKGEHLRVVFGGGRRSFIPKNETDPEYKDKMGYRKDGRNLMKEWEDKHIAMTDREKVYAVYNNKGFKEIDTEKAEYVMGLFERTHMQYELERDKSDEGEPSIVEMVEKAIKILQRNEKGFFLFVEGARIDSGHHENWAYKALSETLLLSEAVEKANQLTSEKDTLIAVTADHSHVFTISGYPSTKSDIMGLVQEIVDLTADDLQVAMMDDNLPYMAFSYANGPGHIYHRTNGSIDQPLAVRKNLTEDGMNNKTWDKDYRMDAAIYRDIETHGAEEVSVHAKGPMSHLFYSTQEQSYLGHVLMYASCVGPNQKHPNCHTSRATSIAQTLANTWIWGVYAAMIIVKDLV